MPCLSVPIPCENKIYLRRNVVDSEKYGSARVTYAPLRLSRYADNYWREPSRNELTATRCGWCGNPWEKCHRMNETSKLCKRGLPRRSNPVNAKVFHSVRGATLPCRYGADLVADLFSAPRSPGDSPRTMRGESSFDVTLREFNVT